MRRKTHVTRQDIPICRPHSTLTGGRSTRIRVWRGPSPRQRPPKTLSTQRPPPHSRFGRYSRTDLPSDHSNPPHRRTRQACLDRRPARGRARPHHYHNTHASPTRPHARAHRHPALTSRGIHHIECSASAPHLRSSAPPLLRHSTAPRGKHACASTHTSVANAPLPLPAFF